MIYLLIYASNVIFREIIGSLFTTISLVTWFSPLTLTEPRDAAQDNIDLRNTHTGFNVVTEHVRDISSCQRAWIQKINKKKKKNSTIRSIINTPTKEWFSSRVSSTTWHAPPVAFLFASFRVVRSDNPIFSNTKRRLTSSHNLAA